jgi:hypothetical protein
VIELSLHKARHVARRNVAYFGNSCNRPRVSGDRDDGTVEKLGDHVALPAFDPNFLVGRPFEQTRAQELEIPLRVFLIKLMLAEISEKKKKNSTMRRTIVGLFLMITSLMMKKILIWPSTVSIFRI